MIFLEKKVLNAMKTALRVAPVILAAALAGCGGGGNESGPKDDLFVTPTEVTVTGGGVGCAEGKGPDVRIYGGQPPYKVRSSVPDGMLPDKPEVRNSGDKFTVYLINGVCLDNMPMTIEDDMGRLATVSVTNK